MLEEKRGADGELTPSSKEEWRHRCQTDLRFLHKLLNLHLPVNRVTEAMHAPAFDFYIAKDPSKSIEEQASIKTRLHLDPRGTFKTSIKNVNLAQWVLCFPNMRILVSTSRKEFSNARVNAVSRWFVKAKNAKATLFQELFPDYCIEPKDQLTGWFTVPCRSIEWQEPTLMASSVEASQSGWHFELDDEDDVVDNRNTQTISGIKTVNQNLHINRKMLMPYGYRETSGTRYSPFDAYGEDIAYGEDVDREGGKKALLVLCRAAMRRNDGERLRPDNWPKPEACTLLFPDLLSYEYLRGEFTKNYESFMTQYMNDAYGGKENTFPRELLLSAQIPVGALPYTGERRMVWRLPFQEQAFAAGAVGLLHNGRLHILDIQRGMWTPSALAHKIVQMGKEHDLHSVTIEATPGARHVEGAMKNYALALGWPMQVQWLEFEEDKGARNMRMKQLEPQLAMRRLLFSSGITATAETSRQFVTFGMVEENEVPDVVSRLAEALPKSIAADANKEEDELWAELKKRDLHDRVYGLGQYAPVEMPTEEKPYEPPKSNSGLEDEMPGLNG